MFAKLREKLRGWKTVVWNGFIALAPLALVALDKLQALDLTPYMSAPMAILAGFVVGGVGILLRVITTGPVGAKGEDEPAPETKAGD